MGAYPAHMSPWPDLTALELLVAVADHGSLGAAARGVGMAQPNASRSVARLERQLGLPLVVRSTRGSTLTPEGLLVVDWARQTLDAARALTEGAAALSTGDRAALSVAASQTVAEHLLPAWLSRLRAAHPDTPVTVHVHNSREVAVGVVDGRYALGFIEDPQPPPGVHSSVTGADELVVVVAPNHPWAGRSTPVGAQELAATPLVSREDGSGTRLTLAAALAPHRVVPPMLELRSNAAVRVSVAAGTAPAVLSRLAVADAIAAGTLARVAVIGLDLRRTLRAVWGGPRRLSGVASELVTIARAGPAS